MLTPRRVVALVAIVAVLAIVTIGIGVGLALGVLALPAWIATALAIGVLAFGALVALKLGSELVGSLREWFNRCRAPDFAGLSERRQEELTRLGVSPTQWNALKNKQRLGFFNITAAIAAVGLSLAGWLVDWNAGGIRQDRVFFIQGPGATNLLGQVNGNRTLFSQSNGHPGYPEGFRQNVTFNSLQLSFSTDGSRLDADIDIGRPGSFPFGFITHGLEYVAHKIGNILGGGNKTNPYNVAYRSSWECA